ncbi:MAG: hypothetical protein C5B50_26775 [Verrucomicrobia bacterium]|nr:MAG: hypothetical protein C5B50_26775 [Verrucomicrobiota bacterium]
MIRDLRGFSVLLIAALTLTSSLVQAEEPDDQYLHICDMMQDADTLKATGQPDAARAKYQQTQKALLDFRKKYPTWNTKVVNYRLASVTEKIASAAAPTAPETNAPASSETPESKSSSTSSASGQVKLLDAGAEPKKVLRFHPKAGDKQTLSIAVKMSLEMKVAQMEAQAVKLPTINITEEATVKSIAPNGDIAYDAEIRDMSCADDPSANPQVVEAMKSAFAGLKGITGSGTVSERGLNKNVDLKPPSGINPQSKQFVDQICESLTNLKFPLPEEAVGPGARWEYKTVNKSQGIAIDETSTYKLRSIEGDRISMTSAIAQSAANQKVQSPGMPGVKMDLSKMTGKGTGDSTSDLGHVLPMDGTMVLHSESAMAMSMAGQKQAMAIKVDMDIRLGSK